MRNIGCTEGAGLSVWFNFWQEKPDSLKAARHCEVAPFFVPTSRWPHLSKLNQNLVWKVLCSKLPALT